MEFNDIKSRSELAYFLKIPKKQLSYILYIKDVNNLYTSFEIPKKNGGSRRINSPLDELKDIQKKLADALIQHNKKNQKVINNISHAFEKDKSIITNAKIHRNKRFVLNIDLDSYFDSFHFGRVRGFFYKNKNFLLPIEVATVIAQISCYEGKLPQGSPCSPIISNLISEILDHKIMSIVKKYKVYYTRYADDLTFSTNDKNFLNLQTEFDKEILEAITKAGFKINKKKSRLQFKDYRQVVTGLVVNKKINVNRIFYKETRSMAHQLYKHGEYKINGEVGTLNQLEGRFAFINQITRYNNKIDGEKHNFHNLSSRELQYQKFLFYKYFFANPKPLIVTEGKTDIAYLKSALKNLYLNYPNLIIRNSNGTFDFKVSFLKKTKRLAYFMKINQEGGSALNNIYNFYNNKKNLAPNYMCMLKTLSNSSPKNPVILMFDNEIKSEGKKPIGGFLNHVNLDSKKKDKLRSDYAVDIADNLYLLTVPLVNEKLECDIEDLFYDDTLSHRIYGKEFTKKDTYDHSKYYGKEFFSKYVEAEYYNINFDRFKSVLDNMNSIIINYKENFISTKLNIDTLNNSNFKKNQITIKV